MPRIVLAAPTHRSYTFQWARGLVSVAWPEESIAKRLDALGVDIRPGIAQGYGAARNMGEIVQSAVAQDADFVLSCEWDHAWDARHLCQIVEAERFLRAAHGCPVVVGAQYPGSATPFLDIIRPLDPNVLFALPELTIAAELLRDAPEVPSRYVEAWLMPAGFALWPVSLFRGLDVEERCGLNRQDYWDAQVSAICRAAGARLFVDLSLDVGHVPAVGISSLEMAKFRRGGA